MPFVDHMNGKCANMIETGQLTFVCTKKYNHKGKHGTHWKARNLGEDTRFICVSWTNSSKGMHETEEESK